MRGKEDKIVVSVEMPSKAINIDSQEIY